MSAGWDLDPIQLSSQPGGEPESDSALHGYYLERIPGRDTSICTAYEATAAATGKRMLVEAYAMPEQQRLRRRVRRLARKREGVRHPNVLPVREVFEDSDCLYLVSDWTDAASLAQWLEAGPLDTQWAVDLLSQVAEGVEALDAAGLTDGLLSPAGILLNPDGSGLVGNLTSAARLTELVQPWVHPYARYFAPELGNGEHLGASTTVYSLGCILFETLAGSPPHENDWLTLSHERSDTPVPALSEHGPDLSAAIDPVIARALAEDARDRFAGPLALMKAAAVALPPPAADGADTAHPATNLPEEQAARPAPPEAPAPAPAEKHPDNLRPQTDLPEEPAATEAPTPAPAEDQTDESRDEPDTASPDTDPPEEPAKPAATEAPTPAPAEDQADEAQDEPDTAPLEFDLPEEQSTQPAATEAPAPAPAEDQTDESRREPDTASLETGLPGKPAKPAATEAPITAPAEDQAHEARLEADLLAEQAAQRAAAEAAAAERESLAERRRDQARKDRAQAERLAERRLRAEERRQAAAVKRRTRAAERRGRTTQRRARAPAPHTAAETDRSLAPVAQDGAPPVAALVPAAPVPAAPPTEVEPGHDAAPAEPQHETAPAEPQHETAPAQLEVLPAEREEVPTQQEKGGPTGSEPAGGDRGSMLRIGTAALVGIAVIALGGYLVGAATDASDTPQRIAAGEFSVELPSTWERRPAERIVPGVETSTALAAGPEDASDVQMVAWRTTRRAVLPSARPQASERTAEPVRLGRFEAIRDRGSDAIVTYAIPTTGGAVKVACRALAGAAAAGCERVASTLRLRGLRPVSLQDVAAEDRRIAGTVRTLSERRSADRLILANATTPGGQAFRAERLQIAVRDARRSLESLSASGGGSGPKELTDALRRTEDAYGSLVRAIGSGSAREYDVARREVNSAEATLGRLLSRPSG